MPEGRLQLDLKPAEAKKARGARLFKLGDWTAADGAYGEAVASLPEGGAVWPAVESLLAVLHANRAMCLLKAAEPEAALAQCACGLALPGVFMDTAILAKLLARKMEALLGCDPPDNGGAAAAFRAARKLGLLRLKGKGKGGLAAKFEGLATQLPEPVPAEPEAEKTATLKELITMLLTSQKQVASVGRGEMLEELFGTMLDGDGAMQPRHVCSVDPVRAQQLQRLALPRI